MDVEESGGLRAVAKERWAAEFARHRARLMRLAELNLNPVMAKRLSPEDLVSETFAKACGSLAFFANEPDVPVYFKLRMLFFQTLADEERRHLGAAKRDAYREIDVEGGSAPDEPTTMRDVGMDRFAATMTGPKTQVSRKERAALLHAALSSIGESDRQIIEMRHFDDMSNEECAEALDLTQKAASMRYVRALERLHAELVKFTEFGT